MMCNFSVFKLNVLYKSVCIYRLKVKLLNVKVILIEVKVRLIKYLYVNDIIFLCNNKLF